MGANTQVTTNRRGANMSKKIFFLLKLKNDDISG